MKKKKFTQIPEYNLEFGYPSLNEAQSDLVCIIFEEKKKGTNVIKIIHGWGSSGIGGKLRYGLREFLSFRRNKGNIAGFIPGEEFNIYSENTRHFLDEFPKLKNEQDFNRNNPGITIIILQKTNIHKKQGQ